MDRSINPQRLQRWIFFGGNRRIITSVITVCVFILTWGLVSLGVLSVGPESGVKTTFGSGLVAGTITVITISLTINQLISSRVFGSPDTLRRQFEGGREIRRSVEEIAEVGSIPVSMPAFISLIGTTLLGRVDVLEEEVRNEGLMEEDWNEFLSRLGRYGKAIENVSEDMRPVTVIATTGGSEYARLIRDGEGLSEDPVPPESVHGTLDEVIELLRSLSISRQYFKTIVLQQDLAQLSRTLIYVGIPATLVAIYVPMIYRSDTVTTITSTPLVVSGAIAVVLTPLIILLVHLLRVTTIMRYTVSVAPFSPPAEWPWSR